MCQSLADGGRRCAAHTRPGFQAAVTAVNTATSRRGQIAAQVQGLDAVARHAATGTGASEVAALRTQAERDGDTTLAGFLDSGHRIGAALHAQYTEIEAAIQASPDHRGRPEITMETMPLCSSSAPETTPPEPAWDPGVPATTAGEHWSITQGGDRWHAGGCGAFAIAMQERWPHLQIACEMYQDHGEESVAHAWAYDPGTGHRFHIFGAEAWTPTETPDYDPDSHRVLLGQTPEDVRRLFRGRNCSEDTVFDAMEVACEMFDPDYVPDDEYDRTHLYF